MSLPEKLGRDNLGVLHGNYAGHHIRANAADEAFSCKTFRTAGEVDDRPNFSPRETSPVLEGQLHQNHRKFTASEIASLRTDLLQMGMDHWQAAEMLSSFLVGRGYGVNRQRAREAVARLEKEHCAVEAMHHELDRLALVM